MGMPFRLAIVSIGAALSCTLRTAPTTTEVPAPAGPDVTTTPASAQPTVPASAATPSVPATDGGSVAPVASAPARSRPGMLDWSEDIEPWLNGQGVPTSGLDASELCRNAAREAAAVEFCACESFVRLGKPAEQVLLCEYGIVRENFQLVRHTLLLGVRAERPRAIWSIPVAIGPVDPPDPSAQFRIRVRAELESDGLTLRVTETPGSSCNLPGAPDAEHAERKAVRQRERAICSTRGEYVWQAGTFRKRTASGNTSSGP